MKTKETVKAIQGLQSKIKIEIFGALFADGKLIDLEGQVDSKTIEQITSAKKVTWLDKKNTLTLEKSDILAFRINDCNFHVTNKGKVVKSITTPASLKKYLLTV
jgi:hypothetical protein